MDLSFYKGKKVFVTGHTGFKGAWLCKVLLNAGADITGYSRYSEKEVSLYDLLGIDSHIDGIKGDVRDFESLSAAVSAAAPDIVLHLAAQPIVRESYADPKGTYETNVMGTVNILESIRLCGSVKSFVNVTTDKVYRNNEWAWGYRENDELNGFDPYSNSKSCSELVTQCYIRSFFAAADVRISTARAGNVIGGGDFAKDRIIPDCIRAAAKNEPIIVRNPASTRPYQFVLEPVLAYLMIAMKQFQDASYAGHYNVGPDECDCVSTGRLADLFCSCWGSGAAWKSVCEHGVHEANFLKLDCSEIKAKYGWAPVWHIDEAVRKTVEWSKCWLEGGSVPQITDLQIKEYLRAGENQI